MCRTHVYPGMSVTAALPEWFAKGANAFAFEMGSSYIPETGLKSQDSRDFSAS